MVSPIVSSFIVLFIAILGISSVFMMKCMKFHFLLNCFALAEIEKHFLV